MKASTLIASVASIVLILAGVLAVSHYSAKPNIKVGGTSPIDQASYHCWAGVCEFYGSQAIRTATGTPCAIQSPAATSTLAQANVRIDTGSSTATTWMLGTGTTAFATTTSLGGITTVAGSAQGFLQGSTSPAAGSNTALAPNTWVIFSDNKGITAGDTAGTGFVPTGTCFAKFSAPQY